MAESSNVRLVRCPKCENLLPELPGYSVYQCGGCGAVLRAKEVNVSQRSEDCVGKGMVSRVSDSDVIHVNLSKNELENRNLDSKIDKPEAHVENVNGLRKSSRVFDRKPSDPTVEKRFARIKRGYLEEMRRSSSGQVGEGTSKCGLNPSYQIGAHGRPRSEYVNPDREELLRKFDELKEQLSRVNPNKRAPGPGPGPGPPYFDNCHDHEPYTYYPNVIPTSNNLPCYGGHPFESRMFRRPRRNPNHLHRVTHEPDPFDHLSCSCYHFSHRRFPPMDCCNPQPHTRWPSELNLEPGSFSRVHPQRARLPNARRRCSPVVGGAPFVTCRNCFEMLKLPKKMIRDEKGEWKMSCGACSSVVSFAIVDEKLVPIETLDSFNEKRDNASFCSEDYANSVYDFQTMDRENEPVSSRSEELHNLHSVSGTTTSDDDPPAKEDNLDHSTKYRAVNRCGNGNLSSRSDKETVTKNTSTMHQNSLKDSSATEMDVYRGEDEQSKAKKGVDTFLAGIIKKSFRDFSKSNQTIQKSNVTINGHLIADRLVKKAEKLAGPIYPGQYWYDFRGGFWGLMGGPCLGIIPPGIEEFNYPMPEKCAGGNTGVFVNGRELNHKDFDLLVSRGLPAARNRSYLIEITGRVIDENSGLELDGLGKLAPTVEKVKHGFGMRAPKAAE